jgi:hypothetical protein
MFGNFGSGDPTRRYSIDRSNNVASAIFSGPGDFPRLRSWASMKSNKSSFFASRAASRISAKYEKICRPAERRECLANAFTRPFKAGHFRAVSEQFSGDSFPCRQSLPEETKQCNHNGGQSQRLL